MSNVNRKKLEDLSYKIIIASAAMVVLGLFIGSFVNFFVFIAIFGAFFTMVGIITFIASQFMEEKAEHHEHHEVKPEHHEAKPEHHEVKQETHHEQAKTQ